MTLLCVWHAGFGGGDNITQNVLFHTCRESSDHGPINSWDRQPFVTTVRNGKPSTQMEWRHVTENVVIANYGGSKQVDNDDGSLFWRVYSNLWLLVGAKNSSVVALSHLTTLKLW